MKNSSKTIQRNIAFLKKRAVPILKKAGVAKSDVFGSYARGENKKKSDIDLLVEFDKKRSVSLFDLGGLKMDLEECLERKVDIVMYKAVHPYLKAYIEKDKIFLYEKKY